MGWSARWMICSIEHNARSFTGATRVVEGGSLSLYIFNQRWVNSTVHRPGCKPKSAYK